MVDVVGPELTLETDGIVARVGVRESRLVGKQVDGSDSQEPTTTLRPGDVDGVPYASVCQPACITHVHAGLPGQVELSSSSQPGTQFGALVLGLIEGELLHRHGVEDSA